MTGEVESNQRNVVVPDQTHDQSSEGGGEQADEMTASPRDARTEGSDLPDPEEAGIVDQQGAALREMRSES